MTPSTIQNTPLRMDPFCTNASESNSKVRNRAEEKGKKIDGKLSPSRRLWFADYAGVKKYHRQIVAMRGPDSSEAQILGRALILGQSRCDLENGTIIAIPPKDRLLGGGKKDVLLFRTKLLLIKNSTRRVIIPWDSKFSVGCGIDSEGQVKAKVIRGGEKKVIKGQKGNTGVTYKVIKTEEEKQSTSSLMVKGEASGPCFAVSGALELAESLKINENSETIVITHVFIDDTRHELTHFSVDPHLLESFKNDWSGFINQYGTHCVLGYESGGSYYGHFNIQATNKETLKKVSLEIKAKVNFFLYGGGLKTQYSTSDKNFSSDATTTGDFTCSGFDVVGSPIDSIEGFLSTYEEFKKKLENLTKLPQNSSMDRPTAPITAICVPWIEFLGYPKELIEQYSLLQGGQADKIKELYATFISQSLREGGWWDAADVCIDAETGDVDYTLVLNKIFDGKIQDIDSFAKTIGNTLQFCYALRALNNTKGLALSKNVLMRVKNIVKINQKKDLPLLLGKIVLECIDFLEDLQNAQLLKEFILLLSEKQEIKRLKEYINQNTIRSDLQDLIPQLFVHRKKVKPTIFSSDPSNSLLFDRKNFNPPIIVLNQEQTISKNILNSKDSFNYEDFLLSINENELKNLVDFKENHFTYGDMIFEINYKGITITSKKNKEKEEVYQLLKEDMIPKLKDSIIRIKGDIIVSNYLLGISYQPAIKKFIEHKEESGQCTIFYNAINQFIRSSFPAGHFFILLKAIKEYDDKEYKFFLNEIDVYLQKRAVENNSDSYNDCYLPEILFVQQYLKLFD